MKKITKATFKSFLRKNAGKLHVKVTSRFDCMTDCCQPVKDGFDLAIPSENPNDHDCGISGVYLVGGGRDYFTEVTENEYSGIRFYNCVGGGIVAIQNHAVDRGTLPDMGSQA